MNNLKCISPRYQITAHAGLTTPRKIHKCLRKLANDRENKRKKKENKTNPLKVCGKVYKNKILSVK